MSESATLGLTLLILAGCAAPPSALLTVHTERQGDATRLTLLPAPGARINARLAPALERAGGSVLRFHGAARTADSSYFTAAPTLDVDGDPSGVVRASICPEGEKVCRRVEVVVR